MSWLNEDKAMVSLQNLAENASSFTIDVNYLNEDDDVPRSIPTKNQIEYWLKESLNFLDIETAQVSVAIVDASYIKQLNHQYRGINKETNVLSFPASQETDSELNQCLNDELNDGLPFLGDIICCPEVIENEAKIYKVDASKRWLHMLIHGLLHLLGMDHIESHQRKQMEDLEVRILAKFGFDNPYLTDNLTE